MSVRLLSPLFLLLLLISGCSPVQVSYDFDPGTDFSAIRTYGWMNSTVADDRLRENPLLRKRIVATIDRYLQQRGYRRVDPDGADMLVTIYAASREKMRLTSRPAMGTSYGPGYAPYWSRGYDRLDVHYYTEGTLGIDIVDGRRRELIWRGLGTGIIQRYSNRKKMQRQIDTYVTEILKHFPPGPAAENSGG
ncbi:DUF4136 domain-containing protein [Thermodesulfobacteriota bacterium B35]